LRRDDTPPTGGGGDGGSGGGPIRNGFATGYKQHSGDLMVYGGGALTLVGVLATVINAQPVFMLISLVGTASAFYFWPTMDTRRPQLGANAEGIYVARIGLIRWDAIADWRIERRALRTMHLATLVIRLDRPLVEALENIEHVPLSERITAGNARVSGDTIRVELHTLAMPVDTIEERLTGLWRLVP